MINMANDDMKNTGLKNDRKYFCLERLIAGLFSFLVVWVVMVAEASLGLVLSDVSLPSALFMGGIMGLLFAYMYEYILFESSAFKGIAFFAFFEALCAIVIFFFPDRWTELMAMYQSGYAFVIDVALTVVLGGYALGAAYEYLVKKKMLKAFRRPLGLIIVVAFTGLSSLFSLDVAARQTEVAVLSVLVAMILIMVAFGIYMFKRLGLYSGLVLFGINIVFAFYLAYGGDLSEAVNGVASLFAIYYLYSNRKVFNK